MQFGSDPEKFHVSEKDRGAARFGGRLGRMFKRLHRTLGTYIVLSGTYIVLDGHNDQCEFSCLDSYRRRCPVKAPECGHAHFAGDRNANFNGDYHDGAADHNDRATDDHDRAELA